MLSRHRYLQMMPPPLMLALAAASQAKTEIRRDGLPYRIVGLIALFLGVMVAIVFLRGAMSAGISPTLADKDFANYWVAAHLAADGKVAVIFGPHPRYFAHMVAAMGPGFPWHNWSYPPHYLLMIMPLALVGYKTGMVLFLAATGALFFTGLNAFMGRRDNLALLAVAPLVVVNLWSVQNGFLTSGLILWVLALRDKRPVLAGICLGAMTIKPQLGVLLLLLPIIERRWLVLLTAALTTVALVLASAWAFGTGAWVGFVRDILPDQADVMANYVGAWLTMAPSTFAGARLMGLTSSTALLVHLVVALPTLILTVFCIAQRPGQRNIILPVAIFLIVPYTMNYDLGIVGAAIALFIRQQENAGRQIPHLQQAILALGMLSPILTMVVGLSGFSIAPVILLLVLAVFLNPAAR
ncbi:MAG: hypothetical protein JWL66_2289 [Sphingomonadales bacterium]|nr:hypothetical protein [Sphingomonadales bacterium]